MSLEVIYPEFVPATKWKKLTHCCAAISFQNQMISNSQWWLKLKPEETLISVGETKYFQTQNTTPDNTPDYYYVVVRYGHFARLEPRIFRTSVFQNSAELDISLFVKSGDFKISLENLLLDVIIESDTPIGILPADLSHKFGLLQQANDSKKLELIQDLDFDVDVAFIRAKLNNLRGDRKTALSVAKQPRQVTEISLYDSFPQLMLEKAVAIYSLKIPMLTNHASKYINALYLSRYIKQAGQEHYLNQIFQHFLKIMPFARSSQWNLKIPWNYTIMNAGLCGVPASTLLEEDPGLSGGNGSEDPYFFASVRTVNYLHVTPRYISLDTDGHIRTQTYLCQFNRDFQIVRSAPIFNNINYIRHRHTHVECLEDIRLFYHRDRFWIIATGIDTHFQGSHQMVLGRLNVGVREFLAIFDGESEQPSVHIEKMWLLNYGHWKCQKNWIPFSQNVVQNPDNKSGGDLLIFYKYEPFTVLRFDENTGDLSIYREYQNFINCGSFRGSAVPFYYPCANNKISSSNNMEVFEDSGSPEKARWVMLVHSSQWRGPQFSQNTYIHRFVEFDANFRITRISPFFKTKQHHMEYVMGCLYDDVRQEVYLSFSENDAEGGLGTITRATLEEMLYSPRDIIYENLEY